MYSISQSIYICLFIYGNSCSLTDKLLVDCVHARSKVWYPTGCSKCANICVLCIYHIGIKDNRLMWYTNHLKTSYGTYFYRSYLYFSVWVVQTSNTNRICAKQSVIIRTIYSSYAFFSQIASHHTLHLVVHIFFSFSYSVCVCVYALLCART